MDWHLALKFNPNHDPKDGKFTFSGGDGSSADVGPALSATGGAFVGNYRKYQGGRVAPEYQNRASFAIDKILTGKYSDKTFKLADGQPYLTSEVATTLDGLAKNYPEQFATLKGVQVAPSAAFAATPNVWAEMKRDGSMYLNPEFWSTTSLTAINNLKADKNTLPQQLRMAVDSGWDAKGTGSVKSIIEHEFGHQFMNAEGLQNKRSFGLLTMEIKAIENNYNKKAATDTNLPHNLFGTYSKINDNEWFACAFAYAHGAANTPEQKQVKQAIDSYLHDYPNFVRGQTLRLMTPTTKDDISQADLNIAGRLPPEQGPKLKKRRNWGLILKAAGAFSPPHSLSNTQGIPKDIILSAHTPIPTLTFGVHSSAKLSSPKKSSKKQYLSLIKSNPYHEPPGSPIGGQFSSAPNSSVLPAEPGTTPIPAGDVRLYHQTTEENLNSIAKNGITLAHAKGIEGPKAIYADTAGFYGKPGDQPTVEFHVSKDRWHPPFVTGDVKPSDIIATHYPWHGHARYMEADPALIKQTLAGEFNWLTGPEGQAVAYIKQKYGTATKEEVAEALQWYAAQKLVQMNALKFDEEKHPRAPAGQPDGGEFTAAVDTQSPAFKSWFGDSKVVDKQGQPLRVFHGTGTDIAQFNVSGEGAFFAASPKIASSYASFADVNHGNVVPVYLSLKNPLIVNDPGGWKPAANYYDVVHGDLQKQAREGGHDGIIVRSMRGRQDESLYIAFHPEQIKSAISNTGDFKPNNSKLTKFDEDKYPRVPAGSNGGEKRDYLSILKFNPNHVPAGSSEGGEFADSASDGLGGYGTRPKDFATLLGNTNEVAGLPVKMSVPKDFYWLKSTNTAGGVLDDYAATGYNRMNHYLRHTGVEDNSLVRKMAQQEIKVMDLMFEKVKPTDQAVGVWRGVDTTAVLSSFGSADPTKMVGRDFVDHGFVSTSRDLATAEKFTDGSIHNTALMFNIRVPAGSKVLAIDKNFSQHPNEQEVVLPRGAQFHITKAEKYFNQTSPDTPTWLLTAEMVGVKSDPLPEPKHRATKAEQSRFLFTDVEWLPVQSSATKSYLSILKFNPNHVPAGSSEGGEFTSGGGSQEMKVGNTTITYGVSSDGKNGQLILMETPKKLRGQGSGRAALEHFLSLSDRRGLTVSLDSHPMDKHTDPQKLRSFYASLGFVPTSSGGERMVRLPKVMKGDFPGHPFHGNQWTTSGEGAYRDQNKVWREHAAGHNELSAADSQRMNDLKIPPAWQHVHLNPDTTAALQAIGQDSKGRTQYRYSAAHSEQAAAEKFGRLKAFNAALPAIRAQAQKDMVGGATLEQRDSAAVVRLLEKTGFRIGSNEDTGAAKKAYGLTTLTNDHVRIKGSQIGFDFPGKKGVQNAKTISDGMLATYMRDKLAKSGDGPIFSVTDHQVRDYIKSISNGDFMPKDFRTWNGTSKALEVIGKMKAPTSDNAYKKQRIAVAKEVASYLNNTPAVALASYIDPTVWKKWGR